MNKIFIIFFSLLLFSCNELDLGIPNYLIIEEINVNDNTTANITDAWVYVDDNLIGVYELPANFPTLEEGVHQVRIRAGIKDNGISGTRIPYPFYSSYIIDTFDFNSNNALVITPQVSYIENIDFFNEDFEGVGLDLEITSISDTTILKFNNSTNNYGGAILIDSLFNFELSTDELSDLPQAGAPVYLELDYKSNTQFLVGVYVNFPQSVLQKDLLYINPKEDWNKIYINLTSAISEAVGANSFKVFISMQRDFALDTNSIFFDNIKVVY